MRGKRKYQLPRFVFSRITPAHAGKTHGYFLCRQVRSDHPRTCGENRPAWLRTYTGCRITPAHAGKTSVCFNLAKGNSDHPRTCGENDCQSFMGELPTGSPPHMRGKRKHTILTGKTNRITPAHAGKTLRKCYIAEVNPHPIRQFPLTSHKVVVSSGNPAKLCVILLYQIESILLKSGVYSPVHPPAFVLQGLTCQL